MRVVSKQISMHTLIGCLQGSADKRLQHPGFGPEVMTLLGGSWVVVSGVISPLIWVVTTVTPLRIYNPTLYPKP